ncbi:uncharacterized protein LOC143286120 [Babylonia areolata]|uniref:uncharacterized protein LOC143286120 n=1 Tax=Babylonia areolata TaxID=304850 RepID=UPI003FD2A9A4
MDNCYGKGDKLPKELMNNQDERLTNKHIQTLSFLKEMASENKQLKQRIEELEDEREKCKELHALAEESQSRIKEIQEKYLQRSDEINQMLAEQHRAEMMEVLDQKMETEHRLKEEILKLRREVESLQRTNVELRDDSDWSEEKEKLQSRITELELLVEGLRIEVEELKAEIDKLQKLLEESQVKASELHQLQDLRSANLTLTDELREANQKNLEYVYKIEGLQKELRDSSGEREKTKLVETMRNKMEKLLKEKELAVMREADMKNQYEELKDTNEAIQTKLNSLEMERAKLVKEHGELFVEYGRMRKRLQQDEDKATFREFVALKRELVAVKNENEILKLKMKTSSGTLPMLKEDLPPPAAKPMTKKGKKKLLAITLSHGTGPPLQ